MEPGVSTPETEAKDESKEVQVQVSSRAVMQLIASGELFAGVLCKMLDLVAVSQIFLPCLMKSLCSS